MTITLDCYHEILLAINCQWSVTADLGHGPPVEVLRVRAVGEDGFEVLTHRGYKVAVSVWTEQRPKVVVTDQQVSLFG